MDSEEAKVVDLHNRSRNARYDRLRQLRRYQALLAARPATGPAPPAVVTDEERIVEEVARALWEADHDRTAWEDATEDGPDEYRRRARAAVAAYRATDGGADALREAVEAVAEEHERAHMSVDPILLRAALAGADGGQ